MLGGHDGIAQLGLWLPSLAQISFCAIAATGDIGSPPMRLVPYFSALPRMRWRAVTTGKVRARCLRQRRRELAVAWTESAVDNGQCRFERRAAPTRGRLLFARGRPAACSNGAECNRGHRALHSPKLRLPPPSLRKRGTRPTPHARIPEQRLHPDTRRRVARSVDESASCGRRTVCPSAD